MNQFPLCFALGLVFMTWAPNLLPAEEKEARYDGKTVTEWIKVLKTGGAADREKALRALGEMGTKAEAAVPALIAVIQSKDARYLEHKGALAALGKIGKPAIAPLIGIMTDPKTKTVARAVVSDALGQVGADAIPELVKLLKHENVDVRYWGAVAIGHVGPKGKKAVEALCAVLTSTDLDADHYIRFGVARALGRIGLNAKGAIPHLAKMVRDDEMSGFEACAALAKIGPDAVPALIEGVKNTKSERNRWEAIRALATLGPSAKDAVPLLLDLARKGKGLTREYARFAVLKIDPKAAASAGIKK
jgi:HEAT repeat protein